MSSIYMAEKVVQTVGVLPGLCPQKVSLLLPWRTANLSTTIPGARLPAHMAFHLCLHVRLFCLDSECKLGLVDDNTHDRLLYHVYPWHSWDQKELSGAGADAQGLSQFRC